jgi:hypothetical protein
MDGAEAVPVVMAILGGIVMGCWTLASRLTALGEESRKKTMIDEIEDHNRTRAELAEARRRIGVMESLLRKE